MTSPDLSNLREPVADAVHIRAVENTLASALDQLNHLPASRARALVQTKIEEASLWLSTLAKDAPATGA